MKKIILDLCGGTGSWSKPYKDNGYDVRNITLPEYDIEYFIPPKNVYGILAAPPCTMFSLARTTAKTPRNFKEGMRLVIKCLEIIWECRYENKLNFWALENPKGYLRQFLGIPRLTFNPCDYGDPYTKATDIWGYFKLPPKNPIKLTEEQKERCAINNRILPKGKTQRERRAITPQGFAQAFYEANK